MSEETILTKEIFEAGINEDRTVDGHPFETYYCPLEYATQGNGFVCFVGDNDATNVEIRVPFAVMEKNGWHRVFEPGVRTYTAADIERIVATAARQQRYMCSEQTAESDRHGVCENDIINAPAPSAADVLAEFEKMNGEKG